MSKIIVALGSFILGVLAMSLFGDQISTLVHPVLAQPNETVSEGPEPIVPPLRGKKIWYKQFSNETLTLDGLDCTNCGLVNITFEYSGGAFSLVNSIVVAPRLVLKGAAANTAFLLALLDPETKPQPVQPNKPIVKVPSSNQKMRWDIVPPYGQP